MFVKSGAILILLYSLSFVIGLLVEKKGLRVNYGRKLLTISFFLCSSFLLTFFVYSQNVYDVVFSIAVPFIWLVSFWAPVRRRSRFLKTCFLSFDRPEDRPFTVLWMMSAFIVGYGVLLGMIQWLGVYQAAHLIFITTFISTFGDGLAEPVGVRFGTHKYSVKALFTDRLYHRTYEGSACVFLSGVGAIAVMYDYFTPLQFVLMILILPLAMAITEAKSPHTWDNPFMHLVGGLVTVFVINVERIFGI